MDDVLILKRSINWRSIVKKVLTNKNYGGSGGLKKSSSSVDFKSGSLSHHIYNSGFMLFLIAVGTIGKMIDLSSGSEVSRSVLGVVLLDLVFLLIHRTCYRGMLKGSFPYLLGLREEYIEIDKSIKSATLYRKYRKGLVVFRFDVSGISELITLETGVLEFVADITKRIYKGSSLAQGNDYKECIETRLCLIDYFNPSLEEIAFDLMGYEEEM